MPAERFADEPRRLLASVSIGLLGPPLPVGASVPWQPSILLSRAGGAINANEPTTELWLLSDCFMNSPSLTRKIQIERTYDDASVVATCLVQPDKVPAIEGQHSPIVRTSKIENGFVSQGLPGFARVVHRHHVMPEPAQFLGNRQREVLVAE